MMGIILAITITLFGPENRLVSYASRSAWLSYPGQYPVSIDGASIANLVWFSDYGAHASYAIWYGERVVEWGDFERIYYVGWEYASRPSIAAIRRYRFFVAWDGLSGPYRIFLMRIEGFDRTVDIISPDTLHSFTPSLTLDSDTTLHIVWQGWQNILYRNFRDGQFSPTITLSASPYAINPTITSFGNKIAVAWSDLKNGLFDIYLRIFDGEWQEEVRVTASSGSSRFPVLAYDNLGILHIAYMDNRDGGYDIYYTRFDGESLYETQEVASPGDALYPSITTTPDGRVHLAWADDRYGNYEIYYKIIGDEKIERITYADGSSSYPALVSDVFGGVWLFYQDRRNRFGEIYYRLSPPKKEKVQPNVALIVYPNPFGEKTVISLSMGAGVQGCKGDSPQLPSSSAPLLKIYDLAGRLIRTLPITDYRAPITEVTWDGRDNSGRTVPSGIYFLKCDTEDYRKTLKLVKISR